MTAPSRLVLAALAALCAVLAFGDLRAHRTFETHRALSVKVMNGRIEPGDTDRIAPVLARTRDAGCWSHAIRDLALLQVYLADLAAYTRGIDTLGPTGDAEVNKARGAALDRIDAALRCTPMDGDLWLRSALLARAIGHPDRAVTARLAVSEATAPHENWVAARRAQFFPGVEPAIGTDGR